MNNIKFLLFVVFVCVLQTREVQSHDFFKNAYGTVKDAVVKGYHRVASIFTKDNNEEEVAKTTEPATTPLEQLIDVRFKQNTEDSTETSFRRNGEIKDDEKVPELNTRFFINAPCGDGTRKSGSGCRQVINK